MERYAWTKPFLELLFGSLAFRKTVESGDHARAQVVLDEMHFPYPLDAFTPFFAKESTPKPDSQDCQGFPLASEWIAMLEADEKACAAFVDFAPENGPFTAWRERQLKRLGGEIGFRKDQYSPLFAFELNSGCSVQCPFCAFDAPRLTEVGRYDEFASLWKEMLRVNRKLFGESADRAALYHATEPADSLDYLNFLDDFRKECGCMPQTTTAAPLRDLGWTRRLLDMRFESPTRFDRFSLLREDDLHRVHEAFTPIQLAHVKLLLHYDRGEAGFRVRAGRSDQGDLDDNGTIACVCGFLVNLSERTVKLISPCHADENFPKGYRVHAEGKFADSVGYEQLLNDMIKQHMPTSLGGESVVRLRDGLTLEFDQDSASIVSRFKRYGLGAGDKARTDLLKALVTGVPFANACVLGEANGMSFFSVAALVDQLFKAGLLEDMVCHQPAHGHG